MKAKIKDRMSKVLAFTLAFCLMLSLVFSASIFYPTSENTAQAAESSAIGTSGYTTGTAPNGTTAISAGSDYNLGSGAHTNKNGTIKVKCLSISGTTAVMQTYGVTAGSWPGSGDLTSSYSSYWGTLSSAISGVKLPTGSSSSNINPSGSYAVLQSAAGASSSFGAGNYSAWLGTPYGSDGAYYVGSGGGVYYYNTGHSYVCAPLFNLDLSKVAVASGTITYSTFSNSTSLSSTQSISSVVEGSTVDLKNVITSVKYANGTNSGNNASYKISVGTGSISGTNWTVPTGINKNTSVTLTIRDTALGLTDTKTVTVTPRDAGSITVEKSSGFPESVTVGDSIDLAPYLTVTGIDAGSQSDGAISSYSMTAEGGHGTFDGTVYNPSNVSTTKKVTIDVVPTGYPVLSGTTGSVSYADCSASFEITVIPDTSGWVDRDSLTDELGFHMYKDPTTDITWHYRYNDAGYILYLYTLDDVSSIISEGHVLLVPSSINGVSVVGIGGGSKDGFTIPFVPVEGEKVNNTWTSVYIPSSVKTINDGAFLNNGASADIVIPGNVNQIGVQAFMGSKIKSVKFNDASNLTLNTQAFADIPTLADVAIRGNGVTIKQRVFSNDSGLTSIDIPNGTKFKGTSDQNDSYAFENTTGLRLIKIDTDTVYSNVFSGNKSLAKVIFGKNVSNVHYDWSGTADSNSSTLNATVDRYTYSLNGDTIFEMNKSTGGSPFGYKGSLTIVGQGLDLNSATNTYNDTGNPVTAKIAYLEKHYRETEAIKTYAKGSASNLSISVEDDPSVNEEVAVTVSKTQTGIEAYYDGIIFTGKSLIKDKMSVHKMFDTEQKGSYESAEFYALRTDDADELLAEAQSNEQNEDGQYVAKFSNDITSMYESKDSVTVTNEDLEAGTVDVKVVVLLKDKDGKILIDHSNGSKVKNFSYQVAIPVKAYTAENDFLENYGSYQAVIDKIDELQTNTNNLSAEVENLNDQIEEKDASIALLNEQVETLDGDKSVLEAQVTALNAEKAALIEDKNKMSSELTTLRTELADTIEQFAELLDTTEVDSSDYVYEVTDPDTGDITDYVLVNGGEAIYDKTSAEVIEVAGGTVTVYTGVDSEGHEFKFYVKDDGVHVVEIVNDEIVSDEVSSDTISAMQRKIAAELASVKKQLDDLKTILSRIADSLNSIGNLTNTDSDYSIDKTKPENQMYNDILSVIAVLSGDIKSLDAQLTASKNSLASSKADNRKYNNAVLLIYRTLSGENLDVEEITTVDGVLAAVSQKAEDTASALANAESQNAVYSYQLEDRNLALSDIQSLLDGKSATLVNGKIAEVSESISDAGISADKKEMLTAQLTELNGYKTLIEKVKSKLSALSKAETDLSNANENIEALEGQIDTLLTTVSTLEETIAGNESTISSLRESVSSLSDLNEDQANTISSLEESVSTLETLSEEQSEQISDLSDTISSQKTKIDEGTATIEELSSAIATANEQIASLSSKNAELVSEISALSSSITTLRGENDDQRSLISGLNSQISTLQENNNSLSTQLTALRGTLSLSEDEIANLKDTVASLQTNVGSLKSENESQAATIRDLTTQLNASNVSASQYKMIVDTANTLLGLNLKNTDTKEEVEAALTEYVRTAASGKSSLVDTNAAYQSGFSAGVASVDVSSNSATYKNGYSAGYSSGLADGKSGTSGGTSNADNSAVVSSLTSQISALSTTNATLSSQNATLTSKNAELSSQNSTLNTQVATLTKSNKTLEGKNEELSEENGTLSASVDSLTKSNSTLSSSNKKLKEKNATLTEKNSTLSSKNKTLTAENKELKGQVASLRNSGGGSGSGGFGGYSQPAPTVKPASTQRPSSTLSPNALPTTKVSKTPKPSATPTKKPEVVPETDGKSKNGNPNGLTKYESGSTVTVNGPSSADVELKDSSQKVQTELVKLEGDGIAPTLSFGEGNSFTGTTDEQKEKAYAIINYYLNHVNELGDLGSVEIKNVSENENMAVKAEVVASVDVTPSAEIMDTISNKGVYALPISSDDLMDGQMYLTVHESEERENAYDISLATAQNHSLTLDVKDLSPVTIAKVSYGEAAIMNPGSGSGGETPEIVAESSSEENGTLGIIYIVLGVVVVAMAGFAGVFLMNRKKRRIVSKA